MFGFPMLYTGIAAGVILLAATTYAGIKGYQFGADREKVKCEVRVKSLQAEIDKRNAEIKKITDDAKAKYEALLEENEKVIKEAEDKESLANVQILEYENEIAKRTDRCLINDDDVRRLQ